MLTRSFAVLVFVISLLAFASGQTPGGEKPASDAAAGTQVRDLAFPKGADLQWLVRELGREMGLNVLFDDESFRTSRKVNIDIKNVTSAEALDYILQQEKLVAEVVGPKTIMIAMRVRITWISQIGLQAVPLTPELAEHFGVARGLLVSGVRADSPASRAGLKVGDFVVVVDGTPLNGTLGILRVMQEKGESIELKVVRNGKEELLTITGFKPQE